MRLCPADKALRAAGNAKRAELSTVRSPLSRFLPSVARAAASAVLNQRLIFIVPRQPVRDIRIKRPSVSRSAAAANAHHTALPPAHRSAREQNRRGCELFQER